MKTSLYLIFVFLTSAAIAREGFLVEIYRLVPAPKAKPNDVQLVLKVVNSSKSPLYYMGVAQMDINAITERKRNGTWMADPQVVCGNGPRPKPQVILPGSYLVVDEVGVFNPPMTSEELERIDPDGDVRAFIDSPISLDLKLPLEPVRFRFTCYEDEKCTKPVTAISREIQPSEFVKK